MDIKQRAVELFKKTQDEICAALSDVDSAGEFREDQWTRAEGEQFSGGGGRTRVFDGGAVFESAGVNFSEVFGTLPEAMVNTLIGGQGEKPFYATGISLVLHPSSPMIPTVHANFRFIEVDDRCWFGGGADLTPYYLFEEDAKHFHQTWLDASPSEEFYRTAKKKCDEYFYLPHRGEARGIGGIFYDYLGRDDAEKIAEYFQLSCGYAEAFVASYLPIVKRRLNDSWSAEQRQFQLLRRGRYVEFNLLHDRGTQFGLRTNGRTESILMSLPPKVAWEYCYKPAPDTIEAKLIDTLENPRDWL
ncbi:UNVERIFIED_CONTAM: hypothetical protein GTU68_006795 [Idotea baltica]|nr:hypothetical protein [Idotea baltica]